LSLINRLEVARSTEDREDTSKVAERTTSYTIGDRVQIRNPNRFQAKRGYIVKIGDSCITVQTATGSKIVRAPKNLILIVDD
jgi:ribosomal protein L21E